MSTDHVKEFLSGFRQSLDSPAPLFVAPTIVSAAPGQAVERTTAPPTPVGNDYWVPSEAYQRSEREKLLGLLTRWETSIANRPVKTLADGRLTVSDYLEFCQREALGIFRRKTFFAYRDELLIGRRLHPNTVAKKISWLRLVIQDLEDQEILPANPARNIKTPSQRHQPHARIAFDTAQLIQIFQSPIYAEGLRPRGGGGEASYWLPQISLYSGLRIEEIAQLRGNHLRHEEGVLFFQVTRDNGGQLKTVSSERRVPLHPSLLETGLLRYRDSVCTSPSDLLFPDLLSDCVGKRSGNFSKFFSRYLRGTVGITDARLVFHSFRHTFRAACRRARIDEEIADALMGHAGGSAGRGYGGQYPLEPLHEAMLKINYPDFAILPWCLPHMR